MKFFSFWNWFVKSEIDYVQYEVEKHFFLIKIWTKLHIIYFCYTRHSFPLLKMLLRSSPDLSESVSILQIIWSPIGETDPFLSVMRWFMRAINFYFTAEFLQWLSSSLQLGFFFYVSFCWFLSRADLKCCSSSNINIYRCTHLIGNVSFDFLLWLFSISGLMI